MKNKAELPNDFAIKRLTQKLSKETNAKKIKKIQKSLRYLNWSNRVLSIGK